MFPSGAPPRAPCIRHTAQPLTAGDRQFVRLRLEVAEHRGGFNRVPAMFLEDGGPLVSAQDAMIAQGILNSDEIATWEAARQNFAAQPDAELWFAAFIAIGRKPGTPG